MKSFVVHRLRTAQDAIDNLPFMCSALGKLNSYAQPGREVKLETFCRVVFDTIGKGDSGGHLALYSTEKNTPPAAFTISYVMNNSYHDPVVLIYCAHASERHPGLIKFALSHIEYWARSHGYKELQTFTPRINGKGFAMFEKCFGFSRWLLHFYKKI